MLQNSYTKSSEAATRGVLSKKVFQAYNFIKKVTLVQIFSCQFCKTSKNTFFTEHLWTTTSESLKKISKNHKQQIYILKKLHEYRLQSTNGRKTQLHILFLEVLRKKGCSTISKTPKQSLQKRPFFLTLKTCSFEFSVYCLLFVIIISELIHFYITRCCCVITIQRFVSVLSQMK